MALRATGVAAQAELRHTREMEAQQQQDRELQVQQLEKFTVVAMRSVLRERGMDTNGLKGVLLDRLLTIATSGNTLRECIRTSERYGWPLTIEACCGEDGATKWAERRPASVTTVYHTAAGPREVPVKKGGGGKGRAPGHA